MSNGKNGKNGSALLRSLRWLTPGMKVKRWLLLAIAGGALFLDGFGRLLYSHTSVSSSSTSTSTGN